jgi:hypothetical protein
MSAIVVMCVTAGCGATTDPAAQGAPAAVAPASPQTFVGTWRSVTPSLEFIGLSVQSKSSEMGVLAARLTFSGVAWEGGGRIDADSLVLTMTVAGTPTASGVIVARATDGGTLRLRLKPAAAAATDLTLVREN